MLKIVSLFCIALTLFGGIHTRSLSAQTSELIDYQNYNHGYCPSCDGRGCSSCVGNNQCKTPAGTCNKPAATCNPNCEPCEDDPQCDPYASPGSKPCPPCGAGNACCTPQAPCAAPVAKCGTECGISVWAIGIGLLAIGAAAAIIVASGNGS